MIIQPIIKHYDWGKRDQDSIIVSRNYVAQSSKRDIPYAELWFPHDTFLVKILSIGRPLSIQSHPDASTALMLHEKDPEHYPDTNAKPEMAIALTDFEAFCGFVSREQYRKNIEEYPCLKEVFGDSENIEEIFYQYMNQDERMIQDCILQLTLILPLEHIFFRMLKHFHNDRGILSVFLMQYYHLRPGEAVMIPPNTIHYYISGDILEIMNRSDNTIRGGLTNKYKDIDTLLKTLDYKCGHDYRIIKTQNKYILPIDENRCLYISDKTEIQIGSMIFIEKGYVMLNNQKKDQGTAFIVEKDSNIEFNDQTTVWMIHEFVK